MQRRHTLTLPTTLQKKKNCAQLYKKPPTTTTTTTVHARIKFCVNFVHYFQVCICYQWLHHVSAFPNAYITFPGHK